MKRIRQCIYDNRLSLIIFLILLVRWFLNRGLEAGDITQDGSIYLPMYYVDLSFGFTSRTFIGELAKILSGNNVTIPFINGMIRTSCLIGMGLLSVVSGRLLSRHRNNAVVYLLVGFILFSKNSPMYYLTGLWPCAFDHYWVICTLLSLLCMKNRYTRWLVPVLCVLGVWINYGYILTHVPFIMVYFVMEVYTDRDHRRYNITQFVISSVFILAFAAYFICIANKLIPLTQQEAHDLLLSRVPGNYSFDFNEIDDYMFKPYAQSLMAFYKWYDRLRYSIGLAPGLDAITVFGAWTFVIGTEAFFAGVFIKNRKKDFRWVLFLILMLPVVGYLSTVVSTDNYRHSVILSVAMFGAIAYLIDLGNPYILSALDGLKKRVARLGFTELDIYVFLMFSSCFLGQCNYLWHTLGWVKMLGSYSVLIVYLLVHRKKYFFALGLYFVLSVGWSNFAVSFILPVMALFYIESVFLSETNGKDLKADRKGRKRNVQKLRADCFACMIAAPLAPIVATVYYSYINRLAIDNGLSDMQGVAACIVCVLAIAAFSVAAVVILRRFRIDRKAVAAFAVCAAVSAVCACVFVSDATREYVFRRFCVIVMLLFPLQSILANSSKNSSLAEFRKNCLPYEYLASGAVFAIIMSV